MAREEISQGTALLFGPYAERGKAAPREGVDVPSPSCMARDVVRRRHAGQVGRMRG